MTDDVSNAVSGWIGPLIGLGFGIATIKMLGNMNFSSEQKTEIGDILSKSKNVGDGFLLRVRNQNLSKAKRIITFSGFKIINEYPSAVGISYLKFVEKSK
mgnify:CR=1 FL=1